MSEKEVTSYLKLRVQYRTKGMNITSEFFFHDDNADEMYEAIAAIMTAQKMGMLKGMIANSFIHAAEMHAIKDLLNTEEGPTDLPGDLNASDYLNS